MVKDTATIASAKKKSKSDSISEDTDIYKKVIDFEAKESAQRITKEDADIYFNCCEEIRSLMAIIHSNKQNEDVNTDAVRSACTQACVKVVVLKKINRLIKFRLNSQREQLAIEKQKVDSTHLQLQNLLYELAHVMSDWDKCRQYRSKDGLIELISIDEFIKTAPEEITKPFITQPHTNDHALHLARLEHELQQRVQLSQLCAQLEQRKLTLAADIVRKRQRLDALGPQLDAVIEASKPLQDTLGLPIERTRAEFRLAALLPDGLYMLYGSSKSYNTVYKTHIELDIVGDADLAQQYADKQQVSSCLAGQSSGSNPHLDTFDSDSDQEEADSILLLQQPGNQGNVAKGTSSLALLSNDSSSNGNDLSSSVGVSKGGNKRRHGVRKGDGKREMLEAHPLSVVMTLNRAATNAPVVKISFVYRPNLHLITVNCSVSPPQNMTAQSAVHVLHGDQLLNELVGSDDHGTTSPNPNTHFQLARVGLGSFKSLVGDVGYAYVWAQNMCGLEFPQTKKCNTDLNLASVETVINALKYRIKMRTKLAEQLNHLGNNKLPLLPESLQMPKYTISSVNKFSDITFQTFCLENDQALSLLEVEIINQNSLYYRLHITRPKTSIVLQAHLIIDNNYPKKTPIFFLKVQNQQVVLTANNSEDIRDLERAVNVECFADLSADLHVNLLALQIYYLCAYFDVYLETSDANKSLEQNSIYFKSVGGRNRRKPFRFRKIGSGIFTQ